MGVQAGWRRGDGRSHRVVARVVVELMSFFSQVPSHFVPRLVEVGRERLDRCDEAVESDDAFVWIRLAADLHALAGEASIMGLTTIGDAARAADDETRAAAASTITAE